MNEEHLARIQAIAEAALLAAGKPLSMEQLRELFGEDERPARQVMTSWPCACRTLPTAWPMSPGAMTAMQEVVINGLLVS